MECKNFNCTIYGKISEFVSWLQRLSIDNCPGRQIIIIDMSKSNQNLNASFKLISFNGTGKKHGSFVVLSSEFTLCLEGTNSWNGFFFKKRRKERILFSSDELITVLNPFIYIEKRTTFIPLLFVAIFKTCFSMLPNNLTTNHRVLLYLSVNNFLCLKNALS